ncbi:mannitol dehydrogenase family protein [Micromonospora sp. R77]|uniref:mannitol dehydrogenase family protein n=1 Tax=Micromonospora sp. R77 TaxID=2925836 RepID=UPI001F61AD7A|nr:mannitol dehydrogenase family protein [Micromonospora sp. R77]MCI4066246.1 mannitol dehydrogenase family protein [Micromonospora sp. R77]
MTARRVVHLGLGNFHRAHQCWWTGAVAGREDAEQWSVTAFTGRRPDAAELLRAQDCRYTLVERSDRGDHYTLVTAMTGAYDGADLDALRSAMSDPHTGIVTLTVTEAGYHLGAGGVLDLDRPAVAADRAALTAPDGGCGPATAPGRLLLGLRERLHADAGPLAVVPCDNVTGNGQVLRRALLTLSASLPGTEYARLTEWIESSVTFVDTSVDRITPRTTEADRAAVRDATGFADRAPVVTEPFRDWVLAGDFPAGRPAWERAGARFVTTLAPWERRKLWLLNGAHSLLAYTGIAAGHRTVAQAIADPRLAELTRCWWDEVEPLLDGAAGDVAGYRRDLMSRFGNTAIAHQLTQIAEDGLHKLRLRVAEPALLRRRAGLSAEVAARIVAAWIDFTRTPGARLGAAPPGTGRDTAAQVAVLSPALADDRAFVDAVRHHRRHR